MSYRSGPSAVGALFQIDRVAGREMLRAEIEVAGGNLRKVAFVFGISREWLYQLIRRENLQSDVDRARASAARPDWLVRARRRLRAMDQTTLARIVDACRGKTADEIAQDIMDSAAADYFQDVPLVAAYLASKAGDGGAAGAA